MKHFCLTILLLLQVVTYAQSTKITRGVGSYLNADSLNIYAPSGSMLAASDGGLDEKEYIVGAGDQFFISILGFEELVYTPVLNYEGTVYLSGIGGINLSNLTLQSAKSKLDSVLKKHFKNVNTYITLAQIRKIRIYVSGNITNPGSFEIYANMRLSDLVSRYLKLDQQSDLRNISVTTFQGGKRYYCDIISFLRLGKKEFNPYLREGDFVLIPKFDRYVSINGSVPYQGDYEFKEGESVFDLIELAGGFTSLAKTDSIEIIRYTTDDITQFSIILPGDKNALSSEILHNRDRIIVRERPLIYQDNIVLLEGYVKFPGHYKIEKDKTTLSEIVAEAGGFLPEAALTDASLLRSTGKDDYDPEFERLKLIPRVDMTEDEYDYYKSKARERKGRLVVDFYSLFALNKASEDVVLRRGDKIVVPQKKNYITIIGQVVNPGKIEFKSGLTVDDYIAISGGFGWRALSSDVRVVRSNTGEWVDADEVDEIIPGDIIWVPEDPPAPAFWDVFKDTLTILGQVATVVAATVAVAVSVK